MAVEYWSNSPMKSAAPSDKVTTIIHYTHIEVSSKSEGVLCREVIEETHNIYMFQ